MSTNPWFAPRSRSGRTSHRTTPRKSAARRRFFEHLEDRRLLAADWHNAHLAADVDADQYVTPLDALQVIVRLNADGSGPLRDLAPGLPPDNYYDTSGDGFLTPLDALLVINALNDGSAVTAQPKIVNLVRVDETTILATYNRPMGVSAVNRANYTLTADDGTLIPVIEAEFAEGESVVQLQTAPQASGYTVNIQNITDSAGQTVFFEGRKLLTGNPKGALVSVAATSSTRLVVVFNEAMADNALAPQNYSIKDPTGKPLLVTDVQFNGPLGMVYVLTTAPQANVNYQLTVIGVTDLGNDGLDVKTGNFKGIAGSPQLVAATPAGPNSLLLTFSRAMSDDALSPAAYVIKDSAGAILSVLSAEFVGTERRLVLLTTGPQSPATYTIQSIAATDMSGTPVTSPGTAGTFQGAPAPSLISAIPTDTTHIFLTFGSAVGDSALSPSSYKLEKLDALGNVTNTLPISEAVFVGSQRTVVSLTTPHQSDARYRLTTTSGLTDASGSPLAIVAREFQGLGSQPRVTNVTSTGPTAMIITFNVPMSDDALTPAAYLIKDSAGVVLPVTNVQFVGDNRRIVQLTTGPQTAGTYTIISIAATDLGGSQVGPIGTSGDFPGAPAPKLIVASPADPAHLVLTFSGPVSDSALAPSSYVLQKLNAQGSVVGSLTVSAAAFVGSEKTVVSLTTPFLTDGTYRIATTSALTDSTGAPLAIVELEFQSVGTQSKLLGVTSTGPTTLLVITSAPMSDDVLAPSSYVIQSGGATLEILGAQFIGTERRVIQLTTSPQSATSYTIVSIAATDTSGNPLSLGSVTGFFGTTAPALVNAMATDSTHIHLTFGAPVGDSALAPASYVIEKLDVNGNVIGSLSISSVVFVGNQRTVVSLTTSPQSGGRYRLSTTSALTDASGAPVPIVQVELNGIEGQARLVSVSSTSLTTMIVTFNVPMSDDALSPALYVIKDAGGNQLPIYNVQFIGTERRLVQLTTAPQTSLSYTVVAINATDVGGNTTIIPTSTTINTFPGPLTSGGNSAPVDGPPRVVGAASLSNTSVLVAFSEPMADNVGSPGTELEFAL